MNSTERREVRYKRRKQKRIDKKIQRCADIGGLSGAFTYHDMFKYGKKCCNGVRWKHSVQNFERHLFSTTAVLRRAVLDDVWSPREYCHFTICERGKTREIDAPYINDRQVQKTLTHNVLWKLYKPAMIYNNGASIKGKGFSFSQKQLKIDLRRHYRKYGRNGYILLLDLKKYFPSASHDVIKNIHKDLIYNTDLQHIADEIIDTAPGDNNTGMPLGVEPSQAEMINYLTPVDNYIKCQLGIKGYGHYMDDGYILLPPGVNPKEIRGLYAEKASDIGIELNKSKTCWIRLDRPFRYCKIKYWILPTGKIKTMGSKDCFRRAKHKMAVFHKMVISGDMKLEDVRTSLWSTIAYMKNYNDTLRTQRLIDYFQSLFGFRWDSLYQYRKDVIT